MSFPWLVSPKNYYSYRKLAHVASLKARIGWQNLRADEFVDEGPYCVTGTDFCKGRVDWSRCYRVTHERYEVDKNIQLKEGDLLVTKDGTIGKVAVVDRLPGPATLNSGVFVLRPKTRKISTEYLKWVVQSHVFDSFVHYHYAGSTINHLYQNVFEQFRFPAPVLSVQKLIADFLNRETARIDELIEKKQKLIQLLEERQQAVLEITIKGQRRPGTTYRDSGVDWIGKIPAHWRVPKFTQVARLESGHTPSRNVPEYWVPEECTIPWFTLADIWQVRREGRVYINETTEKVSPLGLANSAARLLPAGTVMLSRTASVGFPAIMAIPMATSQDFANWVCGSEIRPKFLYYVLRSMRREFQRLMIGSTHQTIYMPDIRSFRTPLPPLSEQDDIIVRLDQQLAIYTRLIGAVTKSIDILVEFRSALITAAVTGQIEVDTWRKRGNTERRLEAIEEEAST